MTRRNCVGMYWGFFVCFFSPGVAFWSMSVVVLKLECSRHTGRVMVLRYENHVVAAVARETFVVGVHHRLFAFPSRASFTLAFDAFKSKLPLVFNNVRVSVVNLGLRAGLPDSAA